MSALFNFPSSSVVSLLFASIRSLGWLLAGLEGRAGCALLASALILLATPAAAQTAETAAEWKAGFARADITPERPVRLAGYSARPPQPHSSQDGKLYAKVLVLDDGGGQRSVLITADLIRLSPEFTDPICAGIEEHTGLTRKQILINVSHNHTSPELKLNPEPRGDVTGEQAIETAAYTRLIQAKIVDAVAEAASRLEPARLSWSVGVAEFVMNRREYRPTVLAIGVNPRGYVDRSVPVLRIDAPDGRLRGVVFGAAAHNTTVHHNGPDGLMLTPEYAGYAQSFVEERHGGVQAMFMLGFAGDANPFPRGTADTAREHGTALGSEVCRVLKTKLTPVHCPLRVEFETVELPFDTTPDPEALRLRTIPGQNDRTLIASATEILARLERNETLPPSLPVPVALWQFGGDLTLVALSGEIVSDYAPLLEVALGPRGLWLAGYSNDVPGYIPSARVQIEGGYEAKGIFGEGFFALGAQDVLIGKVRELAQRAGRPVPATSGQ